MSPDGFEPSTFSLRENRSAIELWALKVNHTFVGSNHIITAFKNTPQLNCGDELNADMSSSFRRVNHGQMPVEDVIAQFVKTVKE